MARFKNSLTSRHIQNGLNNTPRLMLCFLAIALAVNVVYSIKQSMSFSTIVGTSMNPVLNMGDLITNEKISPSEVKLGDIIIYRMPTPERERYQSLPLIAHRVIEITNTTAAGLIYRTKGDNNPVVDPWSVRNGDLVGKVGQQIPYFGFPALFLQDSSSRVLAFLALFLFILNLYNLGARVGATGGRKSGNRLGIYVRREAMD